MDNYQSGGVQDMIEQDVENLVQGLKTPGAMRWQRVYVAIAFDTSGSMDENGKAVDAFNGVKGMLENIAADRYAERFMFAIAEFDSSARVTYPFTTAAELIASFRQPRPGGSTCIGAALEEMHGLLLPVKQEDPLAPGNVAFIFSDGMNMELSPDPIEAANKLKSVATVVSVCFTEKSDRSLMSQIATNPQTCYDVKQGGLTGFLKRFGRTLTHTVRIGQKVANTMGQIGQN